MDGISNVKIANTMLGITDHGIFTSMLSCEGDGWGQEFGGYFLGRDAESYLRGVFTALEVSTWEDLKGLVVRVESEAGMLVRIGHVTKDQWFDVRVWKENADWKGYR